MTLLALAVRTNLVFGPVAPASNQPVLAASTNRAVLDLFTTPFFHGMIWQRPIFRLATFMLSVGKGNKIATFV